MRVVDSGKIEMKRPSGKRLIQFIGLLASLGMFFVPFVLANDLNERPSPLEGTMLISGCIGTLFFIFWIAWEFDKRARSPDRKSGARFSRVIVSNSDCQQKIDAWSKQFGFALKSEPNASPRIFAKKSYPMYPIFVSFETLTENRQKIEGWVSTHNRDYAFKTGFQLIGAIRMGAKELNVLLHDIGEAPIE